MNPRAGMGGPRGAAGHAVAVGVTDMMTSLAVIFVLLLVVFASQPRAAAVPAPAPSPAAPPPATAALAALAPLGLVPQPDAADPRALRLVVPEHLLNFEFGQSALTPGADLYLQRIMPVYARAMCGALRGQVLGIVIEGHTDDLGGDALNLRLSQERSFRVLVRGLEVVKAVAPADHDCLAALASASGRGKQDLIYDAARRPDRDSSRRVVFKILFRSAG